MNVCADPTAESSTADSVNLIASQRNGILPQSWISDPPPLVPTSNINTTPQGWLKQTPPGDLTGSSHATHHPAFADVDPARLTYNVADYSPVLPAVSQPCAIEEMAPELHIPLQQQFLDPVVPNTAPSRGKLTDHELIQSVKLNQCLQCFQML